MSYVPLQLDSATPPAVLNFVRGSIESLYFSDVHAMFRLPMPNENIVAGQNFAIAQILMAVISGVSTTLYDSEGEPGRLFTAVVEKYFPWNMEPKGGVPPKAAAAIIYDVFRNPLTHNAGVYLERYGSKRRLVHKKYIVKVKRLLNKDKTAGHAEEWIEKLEASRSRPRFGPRSKLLRTKRF